MARALSLENKLASDKKPVKVGEDSTGLLLADNEVFVEKEPTEDYHIATKKYVDDNDFAGKIIGYTRLQGDLTNTNAFEIQNSMTVEDDTHQITFTTPSTESVEIEATFLINASSSDTRIEVGLSSANATDGYSAVSSELEYDGTGIMFTDDEIDDHVKTVKWILSASHLASVGSSNTFWIGFSTAGVTKTANLTYGLRASFGMGEHPFIIKATILPSSIYDGQ